MATNSGNSSDSNALDALRGRVAGFGEERLGDVAVARGWMTEAALDGALDMIERGAATASLLSLLVELKLLTREQVDELRGRLPAIEAQDLAAPREPDLPVEVRVAREDPAARFGKFVLVQEVGHGGMGTVWRAWQADLGRWVAVKRLHPEASKFLPRFLREGRLGAQVVHPNLVPIHEVGEIDGTPYLAMALIDGGSLENRRLPIRQAVEIAMAVAYAAHELHGVGIVHRDIKPGNIMIDRSGRAYLGDFSLACTEETAPGVSKSGVMLGTPAYAAPEQIRGERSRTGPRSDVYSLGATLFTLLTGEMPFTGADSFEIVGKALRGEPPPLRARRPEVNHQIQDIVWTAMRKEPEERYATALEFAADLKRYLDGETVHARPPGMVSRLGWTLSRHRRALVAVAALAVATVGIVAGRRLVVASGRQAAAAAVTRAEQRIAEAERLLDRGPDRAAEAHGRLDEARRDLEAALAADGRSARARFWLARVEAIGGDLAAADRALAEAVRLDPSDRQARFERARLQLQRALVLLMTPSARPLQCPICERGRLAATVPMFGWVPAAAWERARALYESARGGLQELSDDPRSPFARPGLAEAYKALLDRRLDDARAICTRELEQGVEPEFRMILGLTHSLAGDGAAAWKQFDALVSKYPSWGVTYMGRACVTAERPRAIDDCARAIALQPALEGAHLNLGAWRLEAGDTEGALAEIALEGSDLARGVRVLALQRAGRFEEAEREADAIAGPDGAWLRALGSLARASGDGHTDPAVMERLSEALARDPSHVPSLMLRAHTHDARDDHAAALRDVDRALADRLAPPWWHGIRGELLLQLDRPTEAIQAFDRALAGPTELPRVVLLRGAAYLALDRRVEALADFDRALKLDPRNGAIHFQRAAVRYRQEDWTAAIEEMRAGTELGAKPSSDQRVTHALALFRRGNWAECDAELTRAIDEGGAKPMWLACRGEARYFLSRHAEALADLDGAIAGDGTQATVFSVRGEVLVALGRWDDARSSAARAIELDPKLGAARMVMGAVHLGRGERQEAVRELERALALDPKLAPHVEPLLEQARRKPE